MFPVLRSPTRNPSHKRNLQYLSLAGLALCAFVLLGSVGRNYSSPLRYTVDEDHNEIGFDYVSNNGLPSSRRNQIAVASQFGAHFDVHLALTKTLRDVLGNEGHIDVFARTPLNFGFQEIVDSLDLFNHEIRHPDTLLEAVNSETFYPDAPGQMIQMIVLGTCEVDMKFWSEELLNAWDARPQSEKFRVVCIVHNFRDSEWQRHIAPWASRGAIRLLPIAYHVGRTFRARFRELADSADPETFNALYEYIDIDVHVPVLNLPEYGQRRRAAKLSRAAIQGSFTQTRRDYSRIFSDLIASLHNDPDAWGYQPLSVDKDVYEPPSDMEEEPFTLHLIGEGTIEIPRVLSRIVVVHTDLTFSDFYALIQSMDVIVPAFVNYDYYDFQASSTVAMAVECNVPILVTRRMRDLYGYIDDDRVTITRPQALREIFAIEALRIGHFTPRIESGDSDFYINARVYIDEFQRDVSAMLQRGWRRSREQFKIFKQELWVANRAAVQRILEDRLGEI